MLGCMMRADLTFKGSVAAAAQLKLCKLLDAVGARKSFALAVGKKLIAREVKVMMHENGGRLHTQVVCGLIVDEGTYFVLPLLTIRNAPAIDMLDSRRSLHAGCIAYMVDVYVLTSWLCPFGTAR